MKTLTALTLTISLFTASVVNAQNFFKTKNNIKPVAGELVTNGTIARVTVIDGDTVPVVNLRAVAITDKRQFKNFIQEWKYNRLVRNVKKAYPYARLAAVKVKEYNRILVSTKSEVEKTKLLKQCEKQLISEFEKDIRDMTMSQGRILLKLIDRETGNTSYAVLKQFRGGASAFMWQAVARLFGNNLKEEYDPQRDDKTVEDIVNLIEAGLI